MSNERICETTGCGIEISGIQTGNEIVWDCPTCTWKLVVSKTEED